MTAQTFAVSVPHASSQLALGRCACPNGASLTTVGSVLVDAAGALTAQCDKGLVAQTNAAMSWLSAAGTQVHSAKGVTIYAGGGVAPGACGAGMPAASAGKSKPGDTTEKVVNATLAAASIAKAVLELKDAAEEIHEATGVAKTIAKVAFAGGVVDASKEATEGGNAALELIKKGKKKKEGSEEKEGEEKEEEEGGGAEKVASGLETGAGAIGAITALASGDVAGSLASIAGLASGIAGFAGGSDLEERAASEIKMVAGMMISSSAAIGFEYKTLGKFGVTAGALTSFTTVVWKAFCLLKFEVKAGAKVEMTTKVVDIKAKAAAKMDAKAALTFKSPKIEYESKLEVTKTLTVDGKTQVNSLEVKKRSDLEGKLTVEKDMHIDLTLEVKKNLDAKDKAQVAKKTKVSSSAAVGGNTAVG